MFAVCGAGSFITTLDFSIVNVAFPEIMRSFPGVSRAHVAWVVTIYGILFGSLLVASGKTADRIGRKRVFLTGTSVFFVGSSLCTVAPTLQLLVFGRAVQGVGGAMMSPAVLGLLLGAFPPERRTQTVSLWGAVNAAGIASGPTLGALLISNTSWRSAFAINLPVCVVVVLLGRRLLDETPLQQTTHRPDYGGAVMVSVALAGLALGISQSEEWGWSDPRVLGSLAVAALLAPLFLSRQRRHPEPVLDLTLFKVRSFRVANLSSLVFSCGFTSVGFNNVQFLRNVWSWSVLEAGLATALSPLIVVLLAPRAGKLATRIGFRPFLIGGPMLVSLSVFLYGTVLTAEPNLFAFLAIGCIMGSGIAATIAISSSAAVASLPPDRFAVGGAITNTARQVGSVLGIAVLVALLGRPGTTEAMLRSHREGWWYIAAMTLASAVVGFWQPPGLGRVDSQRPNAMPLPPTGPDVPDAAPSGVRG